MSGESSDHPGTTVLLDRDALLARFDDIRHFARGGRRAPHKAVWLELGGPDGTRRRDTAFRAAVLKAYLAECCVCGFSLRLVDGLIAVDAAHIRWHSHGGPDEVTHGLALCALHHRLFDHGAITVREDLRLRDARALAGARLGICFKDLKAVRVPVDRQHCPSLEHLRWGITRRCFRDGCERRRGCGICRPSHSG